MLDISSKESILSFAAGIKDDFEKIDILVNNAAIAFKNADPTPFSQQARPTIMTNYFGTQWLTEEMLPLLRKSSQGRIVNVASEAGHLRIFKSPSLRSLMASASDTLTIQQLNDLMIEFIRCVESGESAEKGWPGTCYGTSKAAVIAMTQILAKQEPTVLVNCCCPGYVKTDMSSRQGVKSPEDGAKTPVYLAMLPKESRLTGKFFSEEREIVW